jgi:ribonuclease BN (tRNA processing enzyme)
MTVGDNFMKLTFLGAGDMFSFKQGHNSVLLEFDNTNLVIDFPESNCKQLLELGKDITEIEHIFITHLHEDHINGLQLLGNYFRVYSKRKPVLIFAEELYTELWQTLRTGMEPTTAGKKSLEDYFEVRTVGQSFSIGNQTFKTVKTMHVPGMSTHGLLVEPYFYFSGDTSLDREYLVSLPENVKYIFHECHLQNDTLKSHTSLDELLSLPKNILDKLVLMHYHDQYAVEKERIGLELKTGLKIAAAMSVYSI